MWIPCIDELFLELARRTHDHNPSSRIVYLVFFVVGLELIVDEKTRQVRDDGIFPEYKKHCRDLKVIPNTYLIRQATEDDFKMRHRYLNPNDCRALSQEIEVRYI